MPGLFMRHILAVLVLNLSLCPCYSKPNQDDLSYRQSDPLQTHNLRRDSSYRNNHDHYEGGLDGILFDPHGQRPSPPNNERPPPPQDLGRRPPPPDRRPPPPDRRPAPLDGRPPPPEGMLPPPDRRPPIHQQQGEDTLATVFMEDHCRLHIRKYVLDNARVYVDDAIHVELAKDSSYTRQFACLVTFSARDPDWRLMLHFEQVDINYYPGTIDRFRIYDGIDARTELTPARGLYGKYSKGVYEFSSGNIHDYVSSGPALTLYFIGSPSDSFNGFKVLITVFKDPLLNGECAFGDMKCKLNGYCISESMRCNGAQNCGQLDYSDSHHCRSHKPHNRSSGYQNSTDLGLMVGCALSVIILTVVVIWLGIICMKKKGLRRLYVRQDMTSSNSHPTPDGSIVEPAQIHHIVSPPVSFMEPPPLYSENDSYSPATRGEAGSGRYELPPPYSPLDERDTAGLLHNESPATAARIPILPPEYSQTDNNNATSSSALRVHGRRPGRRSTGRPPVPPVRTSSNPPHSNKRYLRPRRSSHSNHAVSPIPHSNHAVSPVSHSNHVVSPIPHNNQAVTADNIQTNDPRLTVSRDTNQGAGPTVSRDANQSSFPGPMVSRDINQTANHSDSITGGTINAELDGTKEDIVNQNVEISNHRDVHENNVENNNTENSIPT